MRLRSGHVVPVAMCLAAGVVVSAQLGQVLPDRQLPVFRADSHFVRVDAYPKQSFEGTVTQVRNAPISIQNVVTYDVVITVDNRDLKLKPGMTANVTIVTASKENPLRVPNGALRFRMPNVPFEKQSTFLWVLDPENKPNRVEVATGIADSLSTEIVGGPVKEGDRVIIGIETAEEQSRKKLPPGFDMSPRMR